jgi:methylmalonyl-CoA/ethylmalonyl-CoA epimerase
MRVGALHHVAIAVPSIESALPFYTDALGMRPGRPHDLPGQAVRAVFVESAGSRLELIEPTDPSSGVARFLADRGRPTLHHVCYEVPDLEAALAELARDGIELVDREPRAGLDGRVAFLHPRASGGVLIELVERQGRSVARAPHTGAR